MFDSDQLRTRLIDAGLARVANDLVDSAAECISIGTQPSSDGDIPVGASKFGGNPDLPPDSDWPRWKDVPLSFLCQFNLSSLAKNPIAGHLPDNGLLSFFYDAEQSTWGFDPKDRGSWHVALFSQHKLVRNELPESLPDYSRYSPCEVTFGEDLTLPGWETLFVKSLNLADDELDAYLDTFDDEETAGHHLFGHPQEIQGAMQLECQLASNGVYCGNAEGYKNPKVAKLQAGASDWVLLLQIDSDDNPGWMWGDCGCLYFWITKHDLAEGAFNRVWMVLQCG